MSEELHYILEAHHDAATLYVSGTLTIAGTVAAMHACDELPDRVRNLRVCLRAVSTVEPGAYDALAFTTRRWRDLRGGCTRIDPPREHAPRAA